MPAHVDALQTILDLQDRRDASSDRLQAYLSHPDARVRTFAARALGLVGDVNATEGLVHALAHDAAADVRAHAALALCQLQRGAQALARALSQDSDATVRRLAATGLGSQFCAKLDHQALIVALSDGDAGVRHAAATGLARPNEVAAHDEVSETQPRDGTVALLQALRRERDTTARLGMVTALSRQHDPIAVARLSDIAAATPRSAHERRLVAAALRGLSEAITDPTVAAHASPLLRARLRGYVGSADATLAAAAAAAMFAGWEPVPLERAADANALRDAVVAARAPLALSSIAHAAVRLQPGDSKRQLAGVLELGTVADDPHTRAACLEALAHLQGSGALRALQHGFAARDPLVRAGAARGVALLPQLHREVNDLTLAALFDRAPHVRTATLRALAESGAEPALHALATRDAELLATVPDVLRPPFDGSLAARLLVRALSNQIEPVGRALAGRAARLLADTEDENTQSLLRAFAADGDVLIRHALTVDDGGRVVWPQSNAPRLTTEFDWQWLQVPPSLRVRTSAGHFTLRLAPAHAPVHVFHLLRRVGLRADLPTQVIDVTDGCVRFGQDKLPHPTVSQLLRIEPGTTDPAAVGLVGFVPTGLPDLDAVDLFISTHAHPEWVATRSIVGQVVDGMGTVEALRPGDRILDITVLPKPN